jgi:hypothetical protein
MKEGTGQAALGLMGTAALLFWLLSLLPLVAPVLVVGGGELKQLSLVQL